MALQLRLAVVGLCTLVGHSQLLFYLCVCVCVCVCVCMFVCGKGRVVCSFMMWIYGMQLWLLTLWCS